MKFGRRFDPSQLVYKRQKIKKHRPPDFKKISTFFCFNKESTQAEENLFLAYI